MNCNKCHQDTCQCVIRVTISQPPPIQVTVTNAGSPGKDGPKGDPGPPGRDGGVASVNGITPDGDGNAQVIVAVDKNAFPFINQDPRVLYLLKD